MAVKLTKKDLAINSLPYVVFAVALIGIQVCYFFFSIPDPRGHLAVDFFGKPWDVADFSTYEISPQALVSSYFNNKSELRTGPVLPVLIAASKHIVGGYWPLKVLAMTLGFLNIRMLSSILDLYLGPKAKVYSVQLNKRIIRIASPWITCLGLLIGFSLNPIVLFYYSFPSTDTIFTTIFLGLLLCLINLTCEKRNKSTVNALLACALAFLALMCRPSGIYCMPLIGMGLVTSCLNKKYISALMLSIYLSSAIPFFFTYYGPYLASNSSNATKMSPKTLWGTPTSISNKAGKLELLNPLINTPLKFLELSGIRPSYNTQALASSQTSQKPHFYIFVRIGWGLLVLLPATYLFTIDFLIKPRVFKLYILISLAIVPLSLIGRIALERYYMHCSVIMSALYLYFLFSAFGSSRVTNKRPLSH